MTTKEMKSISFDGGNTVYNVVDTTARNTANTALQPNDNISELINDAGYTTNIGTVTSINNTSPDANGNVSLTIPTVNNGTITINQGGALKGSFTVNQSGNTTIDLDSGGSSTVDQTYDGTSANAQSGIAIAGAGFITGINSSDVTTALGYTPYDSANPSGYTTNVGTVTSVNNTSPDSNGNVTISTGDTLPSQSGNSGKFLTTNGSATSWATVSGGTTYTDGTGISIDSNNAINHSNSVTAGTAGTSSATSGSSLSVPYITYDSQGHITATGTHTHTVSGFSTTDTKYTAGSSNSTSKLYLVGATAQGTAASNAQAKTTYSNSSVYTQNGYLYATTPTSSQNDTTVATTAFVKAQGYVTSALTNVSYNSSTQTLTIS